MTNISLCLLQDSLRKPIPCRNVMRMPNTLFVATICQTVAEIILEVQSYQSKLLFCYVTTVPGIRESVQQSAVSPPY